MRKWRITEQAWDNLLHQVRQHCHDHAPCAVVAMALADVLEDLHERGQPPEATIPAHLARRGVAVPLTLEPQCFRLREPDELVHQYPPGY